MQKQRPLVVNTIRFLEYGAPAPKNSQFKGTINESSVFGNDSSLLEYQTRESANDESLFENNGIDNSYESFFDYTKRQSAAEGKGMSTYGILNEENKRKLKQEGIKAFSKNGNLVWDMVISLDSFELAHKSGLYSQDDYGRAITKILPRFFRDVGLDPTNMIWWENYHNNTNHPHMHVVFLEKNQTRKKGKFSKKEMDCLKRAILEELVIKKQLEIETGTAEENYFKKKDEEFYELINLMRGTDLNKINSFNDLKKVLSKTGRLQYNSYLVKPYQKKIDDIVDTLLESDEFKETYHEYLKCLDTLENVINTAGQSDVSTIKERELKKLHTQLGNILLNDIKKGSPLDEITNINSDDVPLERKCALSLMPIGKHKGERLGDIILYDHQYVNWLRNNLDEVKFDKLLNGLENAETFLRNNKNEMPDTDECYNPYSNYAKGYKYETKLIYIFLKKRRKHKGHTKKQVFHGTRGTSHKLAGISRRAASNMNAELNENKHRIENEINAYLNDSKEIEVS